MSRPAHGPPYALAAPTFGFPALAAAAGRAQLGGERESALACLMSARLAAATVGPAPLGLEARAARAAAARGWLAALALPAPVRAAAGRLIEATAGDSHALVAEMMAGVTAVTAPYLDGAARLELEGLTRTLEVAAAPGETA